MGEFTVEEMKRINEEAGHSWFDEKNIKLFGTEIETLPNKKGLFITSEYIGPGEEQRAYTIRQFNKNTGHVDTINEFLQYKTLEEAEEAVKFI